MYKLYRKIYKQRIRRQANYYIAHRFTNYSQNTAEIHETPETHNEALESESDCESVVCDSVAFDRIVDDTIDRHESSAKPQQDYFSNFHQELAAWAIKTKQTRVAVNSLLTILHAKDDTLPRDYRTLCKTPVDASAQIVNMSPEKYIHFGVECCLKHFIWTNQLNADIIQMDISIDGVPVSKSSSKCLWPILLNVVGFASIMLVGVYFGEEKPDNIDHFLKFFIDEYLKLSTCGIQMFGKYYKLAIRCIVADAPARAFF